MANPLPVIALDVRNAPLRVLSGSSFSAATDRHGADASACAARNTAGCSPSPIRRGGIACDRSPTNVFFRHAENVTPVGSTGKRRVGEPCRNSTVPALSVLA